MAILYSIFIILITGGVVYHIFAHNPETMSELLPLNIGKSNRMQIYIILAYFGFVISIIIQLGFGIASRTNSTANDFCVDTYYCAYKKCNSLKEELLYKGIPPNDDFAIVTNITNDTYKTSQISTFLGIIDDCYINIKTKEVRCVSRLKLNDGEINKLRVHAICII